MKKIALILSVIAFALCFSETSFAQKKSRAKKRTGRIAKPVPGDLPIFMKAVPVPCKETETTYPYGAVAGEEPKPPVVKKPCPPNTEPSATNKAGLTAPVKILFRPKPIYTDTARENNIQGRVSLKVTFLKSGQIGSVMPVTSLGYGLTEAAIKAAQQIRFEPEMKNGKAVNSVKTIDYQFSVY